MASTERPYRSELTPGAFLRRSAAVFPERTAVVYEGRRVTYRELAERTERLAGALAGAGLEPGDRVAVLCPNTPAMLEATFAVPAAGLRARPDQRSPERRARSPGSSTTRVPASRSPTTSSPI